MRALKFIILKIVELSTIIFLPYWIGKLGSDIINMPEQTSLLDCWMDGIALILAYCVIVPFFFCAGVVAILGMIYWNLKWAGYNPVWFWTETEDESDGCRLFIDESIGED